MVFNGSALSAHRTLGLTHMVINGSAFDDHWGLAICYLVVLPLVITEACPYVI